MCCDCVALCCTQSCHLKEAFPCNTFIYIHFVSQLQVIKEKGLQKVPGRRGSDDVDDQEGALIWEIHERVPEGLKSAVYRVSMGAIVSAE